MTEATASNYWISSTALSITLNAMGDADYIQANAASGAMIMCYMRDIDGLGYDNGHNYRRWPLVANPTYFNSTSEKYVYAAIPRKDNADNATALVVYPSERVDVYGKSSSDVQLGSLDYYYIFLGGIISASVVDGVLQQRIWSQRVDSGKLASDEAIANGGDNTWWIYNAVDNTVAFLKTITKAVFDYIETKVINLSGSKLTSVAGEGTPITSKNAVVTPDYLFGNSDLRYLRKDTPDTARALITFLKGIALGTGYGITEEGVATLRSLVLKAAGIDEEGNISGRSLALAKASIDALGNIVAAALRSSDFKPGLLDGKGFGIYTDENGRTVAEIDRLLVRMKAVFAELEIRRLSYVGGDNVFSSAGSKIEHVRLLDSGDYRCYFLADDGTTATTNWWKVGDQARCQTFNIKAGVHENVANRYYWRLVVGTGDEELNGKVYHYADLSNTKGTVRLNIDGEEHLCVGYDTSVENDAPAAGDAIVQLGSQTDPDRQYAYIIYVTEQKRVDYNGINDYDLASHVTEVHSASGTVVRSDRFEIISASGTGQSAPIVCERGEWVSGAIYGHYDHVSHSNATWLCNAGKGQTTTEEPHDGSTVWIKETSGAKGDDAVSLTILGGKIIRNGQGSVTLTAFVTKGGIDITDTFLPQAFSWERNSGNVAYDTAWNSRHAHVGKTITVSAEDIFGRADFMCILES